MKLDLTEITGHIGKHSRYEVNEPCLEAEETGLKCVSPIVGTIDFRNTGRHLVVRGEVSTRVELQCGRCLGAFEIPVDVKLDDEFEIASMQALLAGREEEEEEEAELEEEPLLQEGVFDLEEYLRQTILVALPIRPLCDEACKGLCSTCGKNLNEGPCGCPVEIEASPFASLRSLLEDSEEKEDNK